MDVVNLTLFCYTMTTFRPVMFVHFSLCYYNKYDIIIVFNITFNRYLMFLCFFFVVCLYIV